MKLSYLPVVFSMMSVQGAAATLDQEYVPPNPSLIAVVGNADAVDVSQTFTVGITGSLSGFDALLIKPATTDSPLLFDVRRTSAGRPTESNSGASILASGAIPSSEVPSLPEGRDPIPNVLTHVNLTGFSVPVMAGDVLAITFQSADLYTWWGNVPGEYPRGDSYVRVFANWEDSNIDMVFRTYVIPVPEPNGLSLFVVCALWITSSFRGRAIRFCWSI